MAKKTPKRDPMGDFLGQIIILIGGGGKSAYKGIKKLNKPIYIIPMIVFIMLSIFAVVNQSTLLALEQVFGVQLPPLIIRYLIYLLLVVSPFLYLIGIGQVESQEGLTYEKALEEIGFIGKDQRYPIFISKKSEDKKVILTFKSNIPRKEWQKNIDLLETALDCSIRKIREGSSKKFVELVTVPSSYKLSELIRWKDEYIHKDDGVILLGESDLDRVSFDLNKTPHVLAAGETGSGKSVVLRSMLWQMISKGCRVYMIDFKGGVEFGKAYERYGEVIMHREKALEVLQMLVEENAKRLHLFRELEVKNLKEYNQKTGGDLCRIGVFIDEIAEMLDKKGVAKEEKVIFEQLEGALSTLARLSRATGINLFLGVQRPDANVLTGQIKNNVPVRISGRFADKSASEIVLGNTAAVNLDEIKGRFLFKVGNETIEFQGYWFDDDRDLKAISTKQGTMLIDSPSTPLEASLQLQDPQPIMDFSIKKKSTRKESLTLNLNFDDENGV